MKAASDYYTISSGIAEYGSTVFKITVFLPKCAERNAVVARGADAQNKRLHTERVSIEIRAMASF